MSEPRVPAFEPNLEQKLHRIFDQRHAELHAPASFFLVRLGAQATIGKGSGNIDGRHTIPTADTAFRIASCTKSFTAALVLILRDAGFVELDRPVEEYLPQLAAWKLPSAGSAKPTARLLLSMSAGLATDNEWADRQESMSTADFDSVLGRGVSFVSEPGTAFEYSNLGYAILGRLTEHLAGLSYVELVRSLLLNPLDLSCTDFVVPEHAENYATGFTRRNGQWESLVQPDPGAFSAIGGIYSTANDLARWCAWLGAAFDPVGHAGDAVLSAASRREMQQIHRHIPGRVPVAGYGYGLFINHDERLGAIASHSGGYPGFSSHMRWQCVESGAVAIGFENATYAAVQAPVLAAFDTALEGVPAITGTPWPQTHRARLATEALIRRWDDRIVAQWFAGNVRQDKSWSQRRSELDAFLQLTGTLNFDSSHVEESSPARLVWLIPGRTASLRCSILMHPLAEPLIQRFDLVLVQEQTTTDE